MLCSGYDDTGKVCGERVLVGGICDGGLVEEKGWIAMHTSRQEATARLNPSFEGSV